MSLSISLVLNWCSEHPNILFFNCLSSRVPCAFNRRPTLFSLCLRALLLRGSLVSMAFPTPLPHSIRVALVLHSCCTLTRCTIDYAHRRLEFTFMHFTCCYQVIPAVMHLPALYSHYYICTLLF